MKRRGLVLTCLAATLASGLPARAQDSLRVVARPRTMAEDLVLFSQVLNQIRVNHPDSLDPHDLLMAAIGAMVQAADPHSFVIPASRLDTTRLRALRAGKLYPVPIDFTYVRGAPLVSSVHPGSRAVALDILPGDELVAADGRPIAAESENELDIILSGDKGSAVALSLRRRRADGSIVRVERRVQRERVDEATAVPAAFLLDPQTGYVRVTTFATTKVADDLHATLERLERDGMQRLVLDLRGNGGGLIDEAKQVAGEFLPRGAVVYTSSGRKKEVTDTGRVQRSFWKSERRYPIVVLVDQGTASASELVAGALQDHDRALIVGRPTFGKSLIMQTMPLTDGSLFTLVVGQLRTPCGRIIQREYHGMARRDYYRDAGQARDTTSAPRCKTDGGRVVYGGGGIVPDVVLPEHRAAPAWSTAIAERGLLLEWVGRYLGQNAQAPGLASIDVLAASRTLPAGAAVDFRAFAASRDIAIPTDAETEALLARSLLLSVAHGRFGDAGYYRVAAQLDETVSRGVEAFVKAGAILNSRP